MQKSRRDKDAYVKASPTLLVRNRTKALGLLPLRFSNSIWAFSLHQSRVRRRSYQPFRQSSWYMAHSTHLSLSETTRESSFVSHASSKAQFLLVLACGANRHFVEELARHRKLTARLAAQRVMVFSLNSSNSSNSDSSESQAKRIDDHSDWLAQSTPAAAADTAAVATRFADPRWNEFLDWTLQRRDILPAERRTPALPPAESFAQIAISSPGDSSAAQSARVEASPHVSDVYLELPGTHHAFNQCVSPRTMAVGDAVVDYLDALRRRSKL